MNGGLISVIELRKRLQEGKTIGGGMEVSDDDILRAVKSLEPLGSGFAVERIGKQALVRSVPGELNTDSNRLLGLGQKTG